MKVLELFGGIGACTNALKRIGVDVEVVDYVEIDKYAVASYNAINGTNFEPQDICKWDKDVEVDLIMHGSPCQDFSVAGKQAGGDIGSGTRSSLMYETIRIVGKLRPKYVIWENVKNLLSAKHKHNFDAYLETMKALGYTNYYQVLNAKDYGIPQNRERVFTVSILGGEQFEFPKGEECNNRIIEHNSNGKHQQDLVQDEEGLCRCIPAGTHGSTPHLLKTVVRKFEFPQGNDCKNKVINPLKGKTSYGWHFEQAVYGENGIARALKAGGGSGNIPKVIEGFEFPDKTTLTLRLKDLLDNEVEEKYYLKGYQIENIVNSNFAQKNKLIQEKDVCDTLLARDYKDPKCVQVGTLDMKGYESMKMVIDYRIRKLTPKECWRLMGFSDEDFEKASKVNSNSQLYKQAGNSIVVNVLMEIFKKLLN